MLLFFAIRAISSVDKRQGLGSSRPRQIIKKHKRKRRGECILAFLPFLEIMSNKIW